MHSDLDAHLSNPQLAPFDHLAVQRRRPSAIHLIHAEAADALRLDRSPEARESAQFGTGSNSASL